MDDLLERPTYYAAPAAAAVENPEDAEQSSDDDDGGPDWTKLPSNTSARPIIPKRGEKEYEPTGDKGTDLQQYKLDRIRDAMFRALDVERTISSKNVSYGIWMPTLSRAQVTLARGNHLLSVGHSAPKDAWARENFDALSRNDKLAKRVELLPEEALYLIERGSMFCWKQEDPAVPIEAGLEERLGTPMTVQQAFAEMIGKEEITLEKYQVFAYLKRLGYVVTRVKAPNKFYPIPPPYTPSVRPGRQITILSRIADAFLRPFRTLFPRKMDWWKPLRSVNFIHRPLGYSSIFNSLRIMPSGHTLPLFKPQKNESTIDSPTASPYTIFYNLYKPATPYRKTHPPPPDFSVVVIDGRTTPMPTLQELTSLFDQVPELPPPVRRKRFAPPSGDKTTAKSTTTSPPITSSIASLDQPSVIHKSLYSLLLSWFSVIAFWRPAASVPQNDRPYKPNPFQMLKAGKKIIVVAAVDAGMISFFRFGQGGFEDWPMV